MIKNGDLVTIMLKDPITYTTGVFSARNIVLEEFIHIESYTEDLLIPKGRVVSIHKPKEVKSVHKKGRGRSSGSKGSKG